MTDLDVKNTCLWDLGNWNVALLLDAKDQKLLQSGAVPAEVAAFMRSAENQPTEEIRCPSSLVLGFLCVGFLQSCKLQLFFGAFAPCVLQLCKHGEDFRTALAR